MSASLPSNPSLARQWLGSRWSENIVMEILLDYLNLKYFPSKIPNSSTSQPLSRLARAGALDGLTWRLFYNAFIEYFPSKTPNSSTFQPLSHPARMSALEGLTWRLLYNAFIEYFPSNPPNSSTFQPSSHPARISALEGLTAPQKS